MEGSLGVLCVAQRRLQSICLNPCSNGRYSRSYISSIRKVIHGRVLILVISEGTLGVFTIGSKLTT